MKPSWGGTTSSWPSKPLSGYPRSPSDVVKTDLSPNCSREINHNLLNLIVKLSLPVIYHFYVFWITRYFFKNQSNFKLQAALLKLNRFSGLSSQPAHQGHLKRNMSFKRRAVPHAVKRYQAPKFFFKRFFLTAIKK